ncbi:hypothetical protein EDD99_3299 [Streptomyces sp. 846.5]|nr:hypothetical protein [Streptomyces sp. 846.5]TDU04823.1 hypothetical protein EDD99_3299 [Streptomyces sp. 846.5]
MNVGRAGIWSVELRLGDPGEISERAAELDELGYGALWIPGLGGGDVLGDSERLLKATRDLTVATGILSIWRHDSDQIAAGHHRLQQTYGRRLITGLGVSDPAAAAGAGRPFRTGSSCRRTSGTASPSSRRPSRARRPRARLRHRQHHRA